MTVNQFNIYDFFGYKNFEIELKNNQLVLVAGNGAGKTTILKILYYVLSRQWGKLQEFNFSRIEAVIDGQQVIIDEKSLQETVSPERIDEAIGKDPINYDVLREIFDKAENSPLKLKKSPQKMIDLDGSVDASDRSIIWNNRNRTAQVP